MNYEKSPATEQPDAMVENGLPAESRTDMNSRTYETGEYTRWLFLTGEELNQVLDSVGKTEVIGSDIIGYVYIPTSGEGDTVDFRGQLDMRTPYRIDGFLEGIADVGMMNEFPNNFKIRLFIRADTERMIMIDYESDEQPEICEECEPDHLSDKYSCDHGTDVHSASYCVSVGPIASDDEIDSLLVWF